MIPLALAFFFAAILCSAAAERRVIVAIGGDRPLGSPGSVLIGIKSVEVLDLETGAWRNDSVASLPTPLCDTQALSLDGRLYAIGGWVLEPWGTNNTSPSELEVPLVYDPFGETDNWTTAAWPNESVAFASVALMDSKVYAIGGDVGAKNAVGPYGAGGSAKVFDPKMGMWTPIADMNVKRGFLSVAVLGNVLYAAGGCQEYLGCTMTAAVEKYDASTNTWSSVASMKVSRCSHNLVALAGRLYAIGGKGGERWGTPLASVEAYDPVADAWHFVASMPTPRYCAGAVVVDGRVYVVGGQTSVGPSDTVDVYDASANAWTRLRARMTIPRARHGVALLTVPTSAASSFPVGSVPTSSALSFPVGSVPTSSALSFPVASVPTSSASSFPVGSLLLLFTSFLWCH